MREDRDRDELSTADLAAGADRQTDRDVTGRDPRFEDREIDRGRTMDGPADMATEQESAPLLPRDAVNEFQNRWSDIQAGFVDEPRRAVQQADELVADAIKRLAESFAREREQLETQWDRGDDVSTEDLRQALQRYRSFFSRLLSV